jgi:hypothetical protein
MTPFEWTKAYPIWARKDANLTLDLLHQRRGDFLTIITDNAESGRQRIPRTAGSIIHPIEASTPNKNRAESPIRELERMLPINSATRNFDHCFALQAEIRSYTALDPLSL